MDFRRNRYDGHVTVIMLVIYKRQSANIKGPLNSENREALSFNLKVKVGPCAL